MAEGALHVHLVSPERSVFEGEAAALVAPAWDGMVGILPRHAPMLALLGTGPLTVDIPGGESRSFHVSGGVLKVEDDRVTILTERASTEPFGEAGHRGSPADGEALAVTANTVD